MRIEEKLACQHTIRVLRRAGVDTMEALSALTRDDLLKLRGIGPVIAGDLEKEIEAWKHTPSFPAGAGANDHSDHLIHS